MINCRGDRSFFQPTAFILILFVAGILFLCSPPSAPAGDDLHPLLKGLTRDEILRMGEVMYRTGMLPGGEPMQAVVKGDVPADGNMFTCVSCHLRSGFGINEGRVRTPPIDSARLYSPLRRPGAFRCGAGQRPLKAENSTDPRIPMKPSAA